MVWKSSAPGWRKRWTWASMSPGSRVRSPSSMTSAPAGRLAAPTAAIRSPLTTIRPGETTLPASTSNMRAARSTITRGGDCACTNSEATAIAIPARQVFMVSAEYQRQNTSGRRNPRANLACQRRSSPRHLTRKCGSIAARGTNTQPEEMYRNGHNPQISHVVEFVARHAQCARHRRPQAPARHNLCLSEAAQGTAERRLSRAQCHRPLRPGEGCLRRRPRGGLSQHQGRGEKVRRRDEGDKLEAAWREAAYG